MTETKGRLSGKVAIVSGASRGIGHAIAEMFAREGAIVVAGDIVKPEPAYSIDAIHFMELDVSNETGWIKVVKETIDKFGKIDVLVNNAGIIRYEPIDELSIDDWNKVIGVNQTGVFLGMRAVITNMKQNKKGSIINLSSIWGNAAVAGAAAYHATKGAVRNLTKNAALTYVDEGIRVNSVHPGFIETPSTNAQDAAVNELVINATPMKRGGKPDEIAYGCVYLASDESSFVTGSELVIDGGYLAQ